MENLLRICVLEEMGGGFITLSPSEEDTLQVLKVKALAKLYSKRMQSKSKEELQDVAKGFRLVKSRGRINEILEENLFFRHVKDRFGEDEDQSSISLNLVRSLDSLVSREPQAVSTADEIRISGLKTCHGKFICGLEEKLEIGCRRVGVAEPRTGLEWKLQINNGTADEKSFFLQNNLGEYLTADKRDRVFLNSSKTDGAIWTVEEGSYFRNAYGKYMTALSDGRLVCDGKGAWGKFYVLGKVVAGYIKKKSSSSRVGSKWQRRYFRLANQRFQYWTSEELARKKIRETEKETAAKGSWELSSFVGVEPSPDDGKRIIITLKENARKVHLLAQTDFACRLWIDAIQREIEGSLLKDLIPTTEIMRTTGDNEIQASPGISHGANTTTRSRATTIDDDNDQNYEKYGHSELVELLRVFQERNRKLKTELAESEEAVMQRLLDKEEECQQLRKTATQLDDRLMDVEQQLWKAQTDLQATNARQQANEVAEQMMLAERDEDWMRLTKVNESLASRLKDKGHEIEQLERALKDVAAADPDAAMRLEEQQKQVKREQKLQLEKQDLQKKLHSQIESWAKVTARCEMLDRTKDQLQDRLKEAEAALSASMGGSSSAHVSALVSEVVQSEQLRKEKMEVAKLAEANKNKQKELAEKDKDLEKECELLNRKIIEYNERAKDLNKRSEDLKKKKSAFRKQQKEFLSRPKKQADSQNISVGNKQSKAASEKAILAPTKTPVA